MKNKPWKMNLAGGTGMGAALAYFLDPSLGPRRRALIRDKAIHETHLAGRFIKAAGADLAGRARGLMPKPVTAGREADEYRLVERVRSKLGRIVSHPHAIRVIADGGVIILDGPILEKELKPLLKAVRHVKDVVEVENRLTTHLNPEHVSGLQGGPRRHGSRFEFLQTHWSPASRLAAEAAAIGMIVEGGRLRNAAGGLMVVAGFLLLLRSFRNRPLREILAA